MCARCNGLPPYGLPSRGVQSLLCQPNWPAFAVMVNTDSPERYHRKMDRTHSASSPLITNRLLCESRS